MPCEPEGATPVAFCAKVLQQNLKIESQTILVLPNSTTFEFMCFLYILGGQYTICPNWLLIKSGIYSQ